MGRIRRNDNPHTQPLLLLRRFGCREVRCGWPDASERYLLLGDARQPCAQKKSTGHLQVERFCDPNRGFVCQRHPLRPAAAVVDLR